MVLQILALNLNFRSYGELSVDISLSHFSLFKKCFDNNENERPLIPFKTMKFSRQKFVFLLCCIG